MENENITENLEPQGESKITEPEKSLSLKEIQDLIASEKSLKSWFDSEKDKHTSRAMATYRENGNFEKDFQKYAIEKGILPDPNAPATEEEIKQAGEIEKKIELAEKRNRFNDRILKFNELLSKEEIKGWDRKIISLLVRDDSTDENEMFEIIQSLKKFDELNQIKINKDIPQLTNKNKVDEEDMLTRSEFMDLPYKQRIELLKDKRYNQYINI